MKKFKLTNGYHGNVEFVYGKVTTILKSGEELILTEEELSTVPKHKKYLLDNFLMVTEEVEEKIIKK